MTTRQTGALFDITGFVKIEVSGKGALALLQKVCTNNIDVKVGKVVYTVISNIYGGIKSDLTVSRLEEDKFWILAGAGNGMIDLSWFKENAPKDGSVNIIDWTSAYAGVGLWGPNSRKVLKCHVAALPITYRTTEKNPTFFNLPDDNGCACPTPHQTTFPTALDPMQVNRYETVSYTHLTLPTIYSV